MSLSLLLFFLSLCLVFVQKSHFLSVLLVLELMTLSLFMMAISTVGLSGSASFGLVFLVFGVYEAANGLGLLVSRSRFSGVDQLGGLFSLSF